MNTVVIPAVALSLLLLRQRKATAGYTSAYSCKGTGSNKHKDVVPSDWHLLEMFIVVKAFMGNLHASEFGLYGNIDFNLL